MAKLRELGVVTLAKFGLGNVGWIGQPPNSSVAALPKLCDHPTWTLQLSPNQVAAKFECGNVGKIRRPFNSTLAILAQMDDCPFWTWQLWLN